MSDAGHLNFEDVILTGGTGRSGTTVVGKLLSRHSKVQLAKPAEIKFLTSGNGLLDLINNPKFTRTGKLIFGKNANFNRFARDVKNKWWSRAAKRGGQTGLFQGIDEVSLQELLDNLQSEIKVNRSIGAAKFMRGFVDYQLHQVDKRLWIDTTPPNLMRADEIAQMMPGVKFIHMMRDGRDVSSSVVRELWGPKDYDAAIIWWGDRMKTILKNTAKISNQVHHLWLEDLAISNRELAFDGVLRFLGLDHEEKIDNYFENEVRSEAVKSGRWIREVPDPDKFNKTYQEILKELYDLGLKPPKKQI